jgi:hypothetical protein
MKKLIVAVVFAWAAAFASAHAQDLTEQQAQDAMDFAMHDAVFTTYHEIGHLLVGELDLPVLGKEEDAADALATILLLNDDADDDSYNVLVDSADGWYFNAVKSTGAGVEDFSYYDEHSLDIQRAYAMVCMMVGKDPEAFAQTADAYDLDQDRRDGCAYTYAQALTSWVKLLEPHEVKQERGAAISVVYDDAGDFSEFAKELQQRQILERAAEMIASSYVLPEPITFRGTLCGEANAYYSSSDSELTYCYELAADMFGLYVNDIMSLSDEASSDDSSDQDQTADQGVEPKQRPMSADSQKVDLSGSLSDGTPPPK